MARDSDKPDEILFEQGPQSPSNFLQSNSDPTIKDTNNHQEGVRDLIPLADDSGTLIDQRPQSPSNTSPSVSLTNHDSNIKNADSIQTNQELVGDLIPLSDEPETPLNKEPQSQSNSLPAVKTAQDPHNTSNVKNYFKKPKNYDKLDFFAFHPCQPEEKYLPFTEKKPIFSVKKSDGQSFKRQWLSYDKENKKLYCFICLVYTEGTSSFCSGFDDWRHIHQRIEQHETSKSHNQSVNSYIAEKKNKSTIKLIFGNQLDKRRQEVLDRRHIIAVIVDVLKLIGKQGLAFRASTEQAYTLNDSSINHGNFLEILLLLGKYDPTLRKHLDSVIAKSEQLHKDRQTSNTKGRGSFVSFLSNNTIMKIINIMVKKIKNIISENVIEAGKFSILMDTTIDVSGNDQCAFVVRYVLRDMVFERMLSLKCVTSTTAQSLLDSLLNVFKEEGIRIEDCVANAFDGASNMSGPYNGLTAKLADIVPNHIHTWCYAHVLNLVLSDTCKVLPITITFFGILQEAQVFLKESLKRQEKFMGQNPSYKLEAIGATRWRSKSNACSKIFGRIDDWTSPESPNHSYVFFELVVALHGIYTSEDFNSKIRSDAGALFLKFTQFEVILTAMIFLQIFKITTPLSDYLQTQNLDYGQAWRAIESSIDLMKTVRDKFPETLNAAKKFVLTFKNKVDESSNIELANLNFCSDFEKKRPRKKKRMVSEKSLDEIGNLSPEDEFRIHTFNRIIDTVIHTLENRFSSHKSLYLDVGIFDPKRFPYTNFNALPKNALDKLCALVPSLEKGKLREELISFANVWRTISEKSLDADYASILNAESENEEEDQEDVFSPCSSTTQCNNCIKCALGLIVEFNMYSVQYTQLYTAYKFLLTIPLTQVTCERIFSKLKLVKSRLRASMTNETTEALVLMQSEKDILITLESDYVIRKLCESSTEMRRLLDLS